MSETPSLDPNWQQIWQAYCDEKEARYEAEERISKARAVLDGAFTWLHGYTPDEALTKLVRDLREALGETVNDG